MTTSADLKTFLVTDIVTQLAAFTDPADIIVYEGQRQRAGKSKFEIQVKYIGETPVNRESQQVRHVLDLVFKIAGTDANEESFLAAILDTSTEVLYRAYDDAQVAFNNGLASVNVERVRAFRRPGIKVASKFNSRSASIRLEVDEWL